MYGSAKVRNIFQRHGFTIYPTGSDSSHQLSPVECTHRTVANSIRAQLIGANIDIRFSPYGFDHNLCLLNRNSCAGMDSSCLEAAFGRCNNFKNLKYFGSRVWCHPPGDRDVKFKSNPRGGLCLGFSLILPRELFTTIKNLIISRKPATSALTKASMIFLYNNSLQMSSIFGIQTIVLSF